MTLGESFTWAFRDREWPGKMLIQGLIVLIPIVGWIAMTGWLMMAFENARAGKNELPPAGFHLERGIAIFLVLLIYSLVLSIPADVLFTAGSIATGSHFREFGYAASPFFALGWLVAIATNLLLRFLIPSLIVNTFHGGFAGGMDIQKVWRLSTFNVGNTILAALIIWVASVIGGLGFVVCCVGIIFTIPYENTITAGAATWLEKEQAALPAPTPAA
jgi:hypothetical protein